MFNANEIQILKNSAITDTDSYKHSHFLQYPDNVDSMYSYIESRGGEFEKILFVGPQAWIKKRLMRIPTKEEVMVAHKFVTAHGLPFNLDGWLGIIELGFWPVLIRALPEGMVIPTHLPCMSLENTHGKRFRWVPSFLETGALRGVWYPSTVGTLSWTAKQIIRKFLYETVAMDKVTIDNTILPFRLHDFGARGVSSEESAALGGMAHLVNFMGTDTMSGLIAAFEFYNAGDMPGFSIPAAEHSTITAWGREHEVEAYSNMVEKFGQTENGLYAVVSDSYDIFNAVEYLWGGKLRDDVKNAKATLVVRPDSGDINTVVRYCHDRLGERFGKTLNQKGFKVLDPKVRIIQGDGMNIKTIPLMLTSLMDKGWSTENAAMGMGGGLLQQVNRDTNKWAMKASCVTIGDEEIGICKDPVTDKGKASKKGKFAVISEGGELKCVPQKGFEHQNLLRRVFMDGCLYVDDDFTTLRKRSEGIMD